MSPAPPSLADPPRHPWNSSFDWRVGEPPHRWLTDAQVEQFDRDGFVVAPDVFDADLVARIAAGECSGRGITVTR